MAKYAVYEEKAFGSLRSSSTISYSAGATALKSSNKSQTSRPISSFLIDGSMSDNKSMPSGISLRSALKILSLLCDPSSSIRRRYSE